MGKTKHGSDYDESMSRLPLKVMGDRVLIRKIEKDTEKMDTGLFRPGSAVDQYFTGEVIAIGPGYPDLPVDVSVGEIIRYNMTGVMDFWYKDENEKDTVFHIIRNMDVMAVM